MLLHCQGNGAGFALGQQVLTADQPLQFGELTHHLAHQIVLAEVGGPAGVVAGGCIQVEGFEQDIGEPLQALHPIQQAAQTLSKGDALQLGPPIDARHGPVGSHEEFGVGKARLEDPFIAPSNQGIGRRKAVADTKKAGQQAGLGIEGKGVHAGTDPIQGDVALVGAHHGAEHFCRQVQVVLINRSLNHHGCFHQIRELIHQGFWTIGKAAQGCRTAGNLLADPGLATGSLDLYAHRCKR